MPSRSRIIKEHWKRKMRAGVVIHCTLCGDPISLGGEKYLGSITVDHIIPKSCGGTYRMDNVQPAHMKCNSIKGNIEIGESMRDPNEEYRRLVMLYALGFVLWAVFYLWFRLYEAGRL